MGINPLQHIDEVDVGVDALQATRSNQTLNNPYVLRAHLGPTEQPVPSAHWASQHVLFVSKLPPLWGAVLYVVSFRFSHLSIIQSS
jgi:hypothetical protein